MKAATLSPAERERLEELFERALELPSEQHAAFVDRECTDQPTLAGELRRLLGALGGADRLEAIQQGPWLADPSGTRLGPYRLERRLGQGGMGEVWEAHQLEPVTRRVALKLIRPGLQSAGITARFHAERQALARMSHPHVAQVLGGGTSEDGRPYFVMEYVEGEPLTAYCDRRALGTRERLRIFLDVCEGVGHAHRKGLIHRDLKPGNLLVADEDGRPLAKVIDFGVARDLDEELGERAQKTLAGQLVGTLDYMSPEQADPRGGDVDTRSDVYSLGVVLYELVSGCLPFDTDLSDDRPLSEIRRILLEEDPPTPSTRLRRTTELSISLAERRGVDVRALQGQLRGDLDWICLRALEKNPERRYASVADLAADVRRHLAHEPVLARRPSVLYRLQKLARRHRLGVAAGALAAAGLLLGAWGIVAGRLEVEERADELALLYDAWRVEPLIAEADALWPALPAKIPAMEDWLARARGAVERLDDSRSRLAAAGAGASISQAESPRRELPPGLWDALDVLVQDLLDAKGMSPVHGPSVPRRLAEARALEASFEAGGAHARAWERYLPELCEAYPGLDLVPQVDLLPLGPIRGTDLWEFAHLPSGAPARSMNGELVIEEDTGLVLVLLPGGTTTLGSQDNDPDGANYVGPNHVGGFWNNAKLVETPEHEEFVEPFFLSRFEVTRAQWERLTGRAAHGDLPGAAPDHPVTLVDYWSCKEFCERLELRLPDEWEWEYAARGGTDTPWWTGDSVETLEGHANLQGYDETDQASSGRRPTGRDSWKDVYPGTSPVGSFPSNPFGLHDMLGNVVEWTSSHGSVVPGYRTKAQVALERLGRGGSFDTHPFKARHAVRTNTGAPAFIKGDLGFRPARSLDP